MHRREFHFATAGAFASLLLVVPRQAEALNLASLSNAEASQGLKGALEAGAIAAVSLLGKQDGFLGNPQVRIGLPGSLNDAAKFMRMLGQGKRVDHAPQFADHCFTGDYPTRLIDRDHDMASKEQQLSLLDD